ncbi:MAG TPA: HlyC/CorC family transporter [Dehalococcoidia bacterium]|nr:HlyC/CorC family transporter [Dehalococcoidia bacterium]
MTGTETAYIVLLVLCVGITAFFCSSETAFLSLQRVKLEHMVSTGAKNAKRVSRMIEKPEKLLAVVLLGINLANTAAAALGTALAVTIWGEAGIIYATIIITVVILIFAETTPKTFAARHAESTATFFVRPLGFISWLLTPFVSTLSWIANSLAKALGGAPEYKSLASADEIRTMISVGHKEGTVEADEARLLHKVFEFGDRPVHEVMVPRPEVVAIMDGSKLSDLLALYAENPMSRFPVYKESMDNVVGIISVKDVMMSLAKGIVTEDSPIDELVRPAYFTPESKHTDELFAEMRDNNYRMCVVIDEYGGTAGIVSLSRLVEEIVGEVGDELAGVEKDYEIINEYTFQIDGSMRIDEVNEEMELNLPEGEDYETVAGLILHLLGHIPETNEQLRYKGLKMVVTEMRGLKIEKVLVTRERQARAATSDAKEKKKEAGDNTAEDTKA